MDKLKEKTLLGIIYSFFTNIFTQILQFLFGIILARILTPHDYGLIGMLSIFISISQTFVDSGLGTALIRKKNPTNSDYSTVFWYNLLIAVFFYLLLFLISPAIGYFYKNERIINLTKVLGIVIVIDALGSIQGKYLNKTLNYKTLNIIYITSAFTSSIIAIILAFHEFGVWSLVAKTISQSLFLNIGWWLKSNFKPSFNFSKKSFFELSSFGNKILATSLVNSIFYNINSLIIGKLFNARDLGYFTRAKQFYELPDRFIRLTSMNILFPAISYIQEDDEKLVNSYKKILKLLAFIIFPLYLILAFIAKPFIIFLLTSKWEISAVIFQILTISAFSLPFETINENILYIKGKSNYIFLSTIIRKFFLIVLIFLMMDFKLIGITLAIVIESLLGIIISSYFSRKVLQYSIFMQIKDISSILFSLLFVFIIMLIFNNFSNNIFYKIFILPVIGFITYILISLKINRSEINEIKNIFHLFINRLFNNKNEIQ